MSHKKRILVAPLNWGLGHATRSIPIIQELLRKKTDVCIASDGAALELLSKEFPGLKSITLPPYNILYHSSNMVFNMALQLPKILQAAIKEYKTTQDIVSRYGIHGIISDGRFGCRHRNVKSIFVTHQLNIQPPQLKWSGLNPFLLAGSKLLNRINHKIISAFDECWVPDIDNENNLSGSLGHHSERLARYIPVRYLGSLSRFKRKKREILYNAIVVLSGPEPQRTLLENKIIQQAAALQGKRFLIVRGRKGGLGSKVVSENIEIKEILGSQELNEAILNSCMFIGRSGYSSIMDLAALSTPALLIPTPGQTEQQYLAQRFYKDRIFMVQEQDAIDINSAFERMSLFTGLQPIFSSPEKLREAIDTLLRA